MISENTDPVQVVGEKRPTIDDQIENAVRQLKIDSPDYRNASAYSISTSLLKSLLPKLDGWPFAPPDPRAAELAKCLSLRMGCSLQNTYELANNAADVLAGTAKLARITPQDREKRDRWLVLTRAAFNRAAVDSYAEVFGCYDSGSYRPALVESFIRPGEPAVIGAAEKSCKTLLSIDLATALTTGTPFLGLSVREPVGVWALTLETKPSLWIERFDRAVEARGGDVDAVRERLLVTGDIETLRTKEGRTDLAAYLRLASVEVCIADPLYLAAPPCAAADISSQGRMLRKLFRPITGAGAACVFLHHFVKSSEFGVMPTLRDLAGSAIAAYARSWCLLNREAEYAGDGTHHLLALIGSGAGECSKLRVHLNEKKWTVAATPHNKAAQTNPSRRSPFNPKEG